MISNLVVKERVANNAWNWLVNALVDFLTWVEFFKEIPEMKAVHSRVNSWHVFALFLGHSDLLVSPLAFANFVHTLDKNTGWISRVRS